MFAGVAVLTLMVLGYLADLLLTSGKIERNTTVAGISVGGMTPAEAVAALSVQAGPATARPFTVDVNGQPITIDPAAAGLTSNAVETVHGLGLRSANPLARVGSFFRSTDVPLTIDTDRGALTAVLTAAAGKADQQAVEGQVLIDGTTVRTVQPVTGRALDVNASVNAVATGFAAGGPPDVDGLVLPVIESAVRSTPSMVNQAAAQATGILSAPVTLTGEGVRVEVPISDVAAALTVTPDGAGGFRISANAAALRAGQTGVIESSQAGPVDASIAIKDGAPAIEPSKPGRAVDWAATEAAISAAINSGDHQVAVVYRTAAPAFSTEQAQALGIKEVIGEFTTGGFAAASGENIRVVAAKVDGAIVKPGATFGLNEFTGTRGAEQGYVEAAIIQEGALSKAIGGGISQFATTLYNAAYFAGMGDVTHTPHSFYISRYPPGREATVFDGEIELAFSNDYPTGVLIQTLWTDSDITVRLWGTKHVTVESQTGERFDTTPPPAVVKPAGPTCVPSAGTNGFSVVDTRIIKDPTGQEIRRETFTTVYNGQQNVICSASASGSGTSSAPALPPAG